MPLDGISAHPKLDESTGELLFFNYSKHAPYMHYGVVGPDNKVKHLHSGAAAGAPPAARHRVFGKLRDF